MDLTLSTNGLLYEALELLLVHDHAALIYTSPEEKFAVVIPFLKIGLERGERCLFIAPEGDSETVREGLAASGVDTAGVLARGALVLVTFRQFYGGEDPFDPDRILGLLEQAVADAKNAGFGSLRLSDEKSCFVEGTSGTHPLFEYEARMNEFTISRDFTALCLYDFTGFSPETLREVIHTHPKIIFGGMVCRNYNYLPPDKYFQADRLSIEVDSLLQGILANEIVLNNLQVQKNLFMAVFENTPDIVYVKDLKGRYLMINPAGAAFFGKSIPEVLGRSADEIASPEVSAPIVEADRQAIASVKPIQTEMTFTDAGVSHTFFTVRGSYRSAKGEVVGIFGITRDITEQKRAEQEIAAYKEQLHFLASQLAMVEEQERRRIASALHDQVGQSLALAHIKLGTLKGMVGGDTLESELNKIRRLLDEAIQQTRALTIELSPACLYELGLEAAVHSLCEEIQSRHGIKINLKFNQEIIPLHEDLRALLFHGVRELLFNIVKHARAESADISFDRENDYLRITVEDHGIGFDCSERKIRAGKDGGFGLFSLRERLKYYGGSFEVKSVPGQGTRVTLGAPLIGVSKENAQPAD